MKSRFKDHFSSDPGAYAAYRPAYPRELYTHLAGLCPGRRLAWDCATGSGQAAMGLVNHFDRVVATDASRSQIGHAAPRERVEYLVARAERPPFGDGVFDLVTVAQALHWFDIGLFFREAERVLRPGGIVAVWSYNLFRTTPPMDAVIDHLYHDVLGPYWPPERRLVQEGYRTVALPFDELPAPDCRMEAEQDVDQILNYLGTWSAVRRYVEKTGRDPLVPAAEALRSLAPGPGVRIPVRWPLVVRIGRARGWSGS